MMDQFGIDLTEIDAEEVVIRTADEELVFHDAEVQKMDAQGQATYQIIGSPETRPRGEGESGDEGSDDADGDVDSRDVEIVAERTGVTEERAREALEAADGDLPTAVEKLE